MITASSRARVFENRVLSQIALLIQSTGENCIMIDMASSTLG